eukprot:CAMPEP_0171498802 /NCGR_PEP_ID=MMETSP0958-20121227/8061_1 /TAXON_ID=87120 /ORGANISM="Aurantiochytrium limacinum, Strain ATCCMYA-1381" /LENGTH=884 /DNA_ID=CAMNT_0012033259 /DNA_START=18 /DNA_END=2672 /DNA_ORIENTATION=-
MSTAREKMSQLRVDAACAEDESGSCVADDSSLSWAVLPRSPTSVPNAPMSPVRMRLEKRHRSPASNMRPLSLARSPDAKKRRDELLLLQVRENSRKVARAKAIARRRSQEREDARRELALQIQGKLRAAEVRRTRILNAIKERARRPLADSDASDDSVGASLDLEIRISEAEERRAVEYERKLSQVREHLSRVQETCDRLRMTRRVQAWWRRTARAKSLVQALVPLRDVLGFSWNQPSFEEVATRLGDPKLVDTARKFLDILRAGASLKPKVATTVSAARTFLAVHMIVNHPETVLGKEETDEEQGTRVKMRKRLGIAAKNLFKVLRGLDAALGTGNPRRVARRVAFTRNAHLAYARAFYSWKQVDALVVADQFFETYVQIKENHHQVRDMLEGQDNPDPGLLQHMEGTAAQLVDIRTRVKTVLRDPQLYKDWIARVRQRFAHLNQAKPTPSEGRASGSVPPTASLPKVPVSPSTPHVPSNEEMLHRLLVDPEYKLSLNNEESQDIVDVENVSISPDILPDIVADVRDRLSALTPNRADLIRQLEERLDHELLAQQIRENAMGHTDLYSLVQFIGERLLALQAPVRQASTEQWLMDLHVAAQERRQTWQNLAARAFNFVLRELATIELDMANFHLRVLRDHVQGDNGAAYLRDKFMDRLQQGEYRKGPLGVAPCRTESWLTEAMASSGSSDADDVAIEGLVCLLTRDEPLEPRDLPETLAEFDFMDICELRDRVLAFSRIAVAEMALLGKSSGDHPSTLQALLLPSSDTSSPVTLQDVAENVSEFAPESERDVVRTLLNQSANLERTVVRQLQAILRKLLKDPEHSSLQLLKKIALNRHADKIEELLFARARPIHSLHVNTHRGMFKMILSRQQQQQQQQQFQH